MELYRVSLFNAAATTASLLSDGSVLVTGGLKAGSTVSLIAPSCMTGALKWVYTRNLNTARYGHTATLLPNGRVPVAGGVNAEGILNSAELYGLSASPGTIGPGFTGVVRPRPERSRPVFIEVLPDSRFYAAWFAFNPAGTQQAWFTGVGTYSGNTASIATVLQPTGGRWIPNFLIPTRSSLNPWGTLSFHLHRLQSRHGGLQFGKQYGAGA